MIRNPHVIIDCKTQRFKCKNCGASEVPPEMPVKIDYLVKCMDLFRKEHKNCKDERHGIQ